MLENFLKAKVTSFRGTKKSASFLERQNNTKPFYGSQLPFLQVLFGTQHILRMDTGEGVILYVAFPPFAKLRCSFFKPFGNLAVHHRCFCGSRLNDEEPAMWSVPSWKEYSTEFNHRPPPPMGSCSYLFISRTSHKENLVLQIIHTLSEAKQKVCHFWEPKKWYFFGTWVVKKKPRIEPPKNGPPWRFLAKGGKIRPGLTGPKIRPGSFLGEGSMRLMLDVSKKL